MEAPSPATGAKPASAGASAPSGGGGVNGWAIGIFFFLAVLTLIAMALAVEVLYVRRRRMVRNLAAMVGEHLVNARATAQVGGPMPVQMLEAAMNHDIPLDHEPTARNGIDTMLGMVAEAKRRNFLLPLVNKKAASAVAEWAVRGGETGAAATKLMPFIVERHAQHMDQLVAQAYVRISETDAGSAASAMRSLAHQLDIALAAGLGIDPRMVLFQPNKGIVERWAASHEHDSARDAAQTLLRTVEEARVSFADAA